MNDNIDIIRQAGFFKEYEHLSNEELLDALYEIEKKRYSELFGYAYNPTRDENLYSILGLDNKFIDIDLEADVCSGNEVYIWVLNAFAKASNGKFAPTDITEVWESEEGPITVSFTSNGKHIVFAPEYANDWLDQRVFEIIENEMKNADNEKFYICLGPENEWFGQNIIHIRLTHDEKQLLRNKLRWSFPDDNEQFSVEESQIALLYKYLATM